jgi:hypothetical protein
VLAVLPISVCEDLNGAVLGQIRGAGALDGRVAASVASEDVIPWDPTDPPEGLEDLQDDVNGATNSDGDVIKDKEYEEDTYDCDDFASDMEMALEALGYDATFTVVWEFEPNPDHSWWNWLWTPANRVKSAHALTDVHTEDGIIFIEPQTGQVGVDMDYDNDGEVDYATNNAGYPATTDGNARIEVYDSRADAKAAGVPMD